MFGPGDFIAYDEATHIPRVLCGCGSADLVAISPGSEPLFAEVYPWLGFPELPARSRRPVRVPIFRGDPLRAWCAA